MTRLSFIFLCILYILVSIYSYSGTIAIDVQVITCMIFIALVGIPHGAIDHVLFLKNSTVRPSLFFSAYILSMLLYLGIWLWHPAVALILFLIVSAYHFGESQLTALVNQNSFIRLIVFMAWGTNILTSLIIYNHQELVQLFNIFVDLQSMIIVFDMTANIILLTTSSLILLITVMYGLIKKKLLIEEFLKEIFTLIFIHLAFFLLPLFLGFTLYFVVLHSIKVMYDEYEFLQKRLKNMNVISFFYKLAPLTVLSLFGGGILVLTIKTGLLQISYTLLSIVLISLITFPHSIVMYKFYQTER